MDGRPHHFHITPFSVCTGIKIITLLGDTDTKTCTSYKGLLRSSAFVLRTTEDFSVFQSLRDTIITPL